MTLAFFGGRSPGPPQICIAIKRSPKRNTTARTEALIHVKRTYYLCVKVDVGILRENRV